MMKAARFLLIVLLALALPFQGAMAVSAAQCMTLDHHSAPAGDAHDHGDSNADGNDRGQAQNQHCGPCVACCAAAVIASSERISLPEAPAASVAGALPPSFAGIQPDTLDRPPLVL